MGNSLRKAATSGGKELTYRERKHVRHSWQAFCRAKPDYGVLIFVEFFQRYPSYVQLFPPFRDQPLKDLVCNHRFRAHGCAVGHQIAAVVDTLDDPEVMIELIRKNAANHTAKPGVQPEHFERILHVMLETMQTRCPEQFTQDVVAAWTKLFNAQGREDGAADSVQRTSGGFSTGSSQMCTAASSKRTASASEFTAAPSSVSLPTVPVGVRPESMRPPTHSESRSSDAGGAVDLHTGP
ncbi:hypothetical protein HPB50_010053 [Hyalomma asiaticum]|uniref:Uncharacterized protein n=1 Tax=Hyalomma asiaticum TaxID=266040 RepID=A0ACB7S0F8_HYAAI|nr:hypothetical protein HPB50_010053 [Hyalomma asiaticum]